MKKLLVVAPGYTLQDDIARLGQAEVDSRKVMAVNLAVIDWPGRVDYFASLHPEILSMFCPKGTHRGFHDMRLANNLNGDYEVCAPHFPFPFNPFTKPADHIMNFCIMGGTSGLYAVQCGKALGFEDIIIAGVTLTYGPYHRKWSCWHSTTGRAKSTQDHKSNYSPRVLKSWESAKELGIFKGVKACSGWPAELIGSPFGTRRNPWLP